MLALEFDPTRLGLTETWAAASVDVTVGLDTETFSLPAGITDAYSAYAALVEWMADPARLWAPMSVELTWTSESSDNGIPVVQFWPSNINELDDFSPNADWRALTQGVDNPVAVTIRPELGWTLQEWVPRGLRGDGTAKGATRDSVPVWGDLRWTAEAVMTRATLDAFTALLYAATSPRRGWVLQQSTGPSGIDQWGIWRQAAIGAVTVSREGARLYRVAMELSGAAL